MTTENLERAFRNTRAIVANITPDQLSNPTPCASWDVRTLLNHVIGGAYHFAHAINTGKGTGDDDRDYVAGDFVATYDEGIKRAVEGFAAPGAMEKTVELGFGSLPAPAWLGIATTDTLMHGWDLARATGQPTDIDPDFAVEVLAGARAFIQPEFRGEDTTAPFGAETEPPAGASEADKLAAFLGRRV
jgi:uncharacterized protein (TIGR03086 family)